jgi:hypothetical protein
LPYFAALSGDSCSPPVLALLKVRDPADSQVTNSVLSFADLDEANEDFGDSLFRFMLHDLTDCDRDQAVGRLQVAIDELISVADAIVAEP